jgi:hypothetical protein
MADAPDSKSGPRKGVWVQVPPSVLYNVRTYGDQGERGFRLPKRSSQDFTENAPFDVILAPVERSEPLLRLCLSSVDSVLLAHRTFDGIP